MSIANRYYFSITESATSLSFINAGFLYNTQNRSRGTRAKQCSPDIHVGGSKASPIIIVPAGTAPMGRLINTILFDYRLSPNIFFIIFYVMNL